MQKGKLNIVFGGQAGSEAKGKASAYLADKFDVTVVAGALSPNAGHTVVKDGMKIVTHHIPVGVAGTQYPSGALVIMGPASVINPGLLLREIGGLERDIGFRRDNLFIDSRAAIIQQSHVRDEENHMTHIGSTAQGVGEARVDRLMRRGVRAGSVEDLSPFIVEDAPYMLRSALNAGKMVLYEMGQGFDLCLYHGVDPVYCTSRNCTPMQALADAGVPASMLGDVYAVIRPYPIRVNNRTGSSGPYPSQEIVWDEVRRRCGAPHDITEITTTTKLVRRVFELSMERIQYMVKTCDPDYLILQFANYIDWGAYGMKNVLDLPPSVYGFVKGLEKRTGVPVGYVGTGPDHTQMIDMGVDR